MNLEVIKAQALICQKYAAPYLAAAPESKLGMASNVEGKLLPLNGLRHPPENGTCGWFIWAGEVFSKADNFFKAIHVSHVGEICPRILPYLGLAAGWRFFD
jgi:hypothetical protein